MDKDITYIVNSKGLTLTPVKKGQQELDLAHGDPISRAVLLEYTRPVYIDAMIRKGDLKVQDA